MSRPRHRPAADPGTPRARDRAASGGDRREGLDAGVRALSAVAGNRAVAAAVARRPDPRAPKPLGWDVASTVAKHAPRILPDIPAEQMAAFQRWVDVGATNVDVDRRVEEATGEWRQRTGIYGHDDFMQEPDRRRIRGIGAQRMGRDEEGPAIHVPTAAILDDDMLPEGAPLFDQAEAAWRARTRATLLAHPQTEVEVSDQHWGVMLSWKGHHLQDIGGKVHAGILSQHELFAADYETEVAEPRRQLRRAVPELISFMDACREEHKWRSDKNDEGIITAGVRHVAEFLGDGDEDYPTIRGWNEPQKLARLAQEAIGERQYDLAILRYVRAHALGTAQAERFQKYEQRVTSGAGIAVTWLERMKTAGTIAAGLASGGLGLAARAGIAGGYTFVREGAQQASEVAHGQRKDMDVGTMAQQATIDAAMSVVGGRIEGAFGATLSTRFGARLASRYGPDIAEKGIAMAAAGAAGFYTAPAQKVLDVIIAGGRVPGSLGELADMIADEAIKGAAMEGILGSLMPGAPRASRDPWAGGASSIDARWPAPTIDAPPVPGGVRTGTTTGGPGAHGPSAVGGVAGPPASHSTAAPADARPPSHLFELAARAHQSHGATDRLIDHFGSWEQAVARLRAGTGEAAGLAQPMRDRLLETMARRRAAVVDEVARFGARPVASGSTEPGSDVDLNVAGANAGIKEVQARAHLDQRYPGWEGRFRMSLMVGSTRMGALGAMVGRLPPDLRAQVERHQVLATEAYAVAREARAAPEADRAAVLARIADPALRQEAGRMAAMGPDEVARTRAELLTRSDRLRAQAAAARTDAERAQAVMEAMDVQMRANALDADAYVSGGAIRAVVMGRTDLRPAERYQAVVDQIAMIRHVADDAGGMRGALRRYETFKYVARLVDQLRALGVADPRLAFLRNHAELVSRVDRGATSSDAPRTVTGRDLARGAPTAAVRHDDLGTVAGVSDRFLADVHAMLSGVLDQHLPAVRARVLGEPGGAGAGAAAPLRLPELGPPPAPQAPGPAPGGEGRERGLTSPDAMDRIVTQAAEAHPTGSLQEFARSLHGQMAHELHAIGAAPPTVVARDMGDASLLGAFYPGRNEIVINAGQAQFDPATPQGQRAVLRLLLHESRHAEQWFHALRHMARTHGSGWRAEAQALGVHPSIVEAAARAPLPPGTTPDGETAARIHDELLGTGRHITALGQDTAAKVRLRTAIERHTEDRARAQAELDRIPWNDMARWKEGEARVRELDERLALVRGDLQMREDIYWNLTHEVDARRAESLLVQAIEGREMTAAARRLESAVEMLGVVRRLAPHDEAQALRAVEDAFADYRATLTEVGRSLRELRPR